VWSGEELGAKFEEVEIPGELMAEAKEGHTKLVEAAADKDEELMHLYLEGKEISQQQLQQGIRRLVIKNELVPVICGAAFKNKGVQTLLDAVVDYLPSPLDIPDIVGTNPDSKQPESRSAGDYAPFCALAF